MAKPKNDLSTWVSESNPDATRALIDELGTEGHPYDKLEAGEKKYITNYRRICPKRPNWENPYQVIPVHFLKPNNRQVVCLKSAGLGMCPACTLRVELEAGEKGAGRELRTSIRTFMNVVHIDADGVLVEDKVFLLSLNQLQFLGKRGVEYDEDEESDLPLFHFFEKYGDLSHVETGRDLVIKAKKDKSGDYDTVAMKFVAADPSPFPGTSELLEEGLIELPSAVSIVEPTEMMGIIEGRSAGAMRIEGPKEAPAAQIEAPKSPGRFGGADEEEEAEEAPAPAEDARAASSPPKTDPSEAVARLRKAANGGK